MELQVACQSAVSQEQVEGMLTENEALRTNLAALEQVQLDKRHPYSSAIIAIRSYDNVRYCQLSRNTVFESCQNGANYNTTARRLSSDLFISWGKKFN